MLGAEIQHFLRLGYATNQRTSKCSPHADQAKNINRNGRIIRPRWAIGSNQIKGSSRFSDAAHRKAIGGRFLFCKIKTADIREWRAGGWCHGPARGYARSNLAKEVSLAKT